MKNQQLKRPNTIANKHVGGQKIQPNTQQFDINGIKMGMDKEFGSPGLPNSMNSFGNDRQIPQDNRQVNQKNMNEIYDMLEKYA